MHGSGFLIDTNITIALLAKEPTIVKKVSSTPSRYFVPSIVIGELFYGAEKSSRKDANTARVEEFLRASTVVSCDAVVGRLYGKIKWQLRAKGSPIPENDIWIASMALKFGLTLITRDHHFDKIDSLLVQSW